MRINRTKILFSIAGALFLGWILVITLFASASIADDCIKDGDMVSLTGKVWRETFPGRPNYESIENGDEPETVWILTLDKSRCVIGKSEEGTPYQIGKVSRFQLVLTEEQYRKEKNLLEKRALVKGQIFQAITGHHHTKALIDVKEIKAAKSK